LTSIVNQSGDIHCGSLMATSELQIIDDQGLSMKTLKDSTSIVLSCN